VVPPGPGSNAGALSRSLPVAQSDPHSATGFSDADPTASASTAASASTPSASTAAASPTDMPARIVRRLGHDIRGIRDLRVHPHSDSDAAAASPTSTRTSPS
jgi:hypothetical protein